MHARLSVCWSLLQNGRSSLPGHAPGFQQHDIARPMSQPSRQLTQEDVPIGQPLPFALADGVGRLLLPAGAVVPVAEDARLLFHHGPVLAADPSGDAGAGSSPVPPEGKPRLGATGLSIGTVLQVQEKSAPLRAALPCRLIGYIEGEALFITQPADAKRTLRPEIRDVLLLRGFSGRAVVSMLCSVVGAGQFPAPYLVLAMPTKVHKVQLRKAKRVCRTASNGLVSVVQRHDQWLYSRRTQANQHVHRRPPRVLILQQDH